MPLRRDAIVSARAAAKLVHVRMSVLLEALDSGRLLGTRQHQHSGRWRIRVGELKRWAARRVSEQRR
jgi:hypothetical protein